MREQSSALHENVPKDQATARENRQGMQNMNFIGYC